MQTPFIPREGITLEFLARPFGATLLQPLITSAALLASVKFPAEFNTLLNAATRGRIGSTTCSTALRVLFVAGTIYRANRMLSNRFLNNFVSDRTWDSEREIVLVTGGCSGMGRLMVEKLASLGVRTVVFDVVEPKQALPPNSTFFKVDITSSAAIHEAAEKIRKQIGHPTALINNAGIGWNKEILKQTEAQIRKTFDVNIVSHFLMVREFAPAMIERDHGHIVTIASMASFLVHAGNVDYACTKAAALAFHEGLSQELKSRYSASKVRTTVVHPTWVRTPMIESLTRDSNFNEFVLDPMTVADAVVDQLLKGESAQLILPARLGIMSGARGWASWIQEKIRNSTADVLPRT